MTSRKHPTRQPAKRWTASIVLVVVAAGVAVAALSVDHWWPLDKPRANPPALYDVRIGQTLWQVELALTEPQQRLGLGRRDALPDGRGMLFVYGAPHVMGFWMKDCRIPLDIAFLDADLRVVRMHTMPNEPLDTPDGRLTTYSSGVPAQFALEVPAGALRQAGVRVGDLVTFDPNIPIPGKGP